MPLSQFQILQKIGQGAYSTVHKVKRISDDKIYALKQVPTLYQRPQVKINNLKEKQKENALNQVRLLASISCQHIIKYKESFFDEKSSTLCMIIQYAQNGDLEKLITKHKNSMSSFAESEIWKMAKNVLSALNVLHQKQIIHRDLKSANIFISKDAYKIADLNVSKLLKHTLAYTQTGTPYYASPQVWQDKPYELKSDIWSLGCILYEAAALRPPFTATSMDGLYKKVLKGVYPRLPSNYSHHLESFIGKCLQLSPTKRPTAKDLLSMLPQTYENPEIDYQSQTNPEINLLSTIKVPRNMNSWRKDLPKADYQRDTFQNQSNYSVQNYISQNGSKKYGHLSQNKLRDIVRAKQVQRHALDKKLSLKKINTQSNQIYESIRTKVHTQAYQHPGSQASLYSHQKVFIPRMNKIYSDAANQIEYNRKINENHNRVQQILNRMKEVEKKKYVHNKPVWWG